MIPGSTAGTTEWISGMLLQPFTVWDAQNLKCGFRVEDMKIMKKNLEMNVAGVLFFVSIAQFFLMMLLAETIYPNYSVSHNYISDLGVGKTAYIFNVSIVLMGILLIAAAYISRSFSRVFSVIIVLAGVGAMGVGIFPETTGSIHVYSSLLVFLMASIAPYIIIYKLKNSLSVAWAILGTIGLVSLILYATGHYLGLGVGGMERFIVYPDLLWGMGFGGWLLGKGQAEGGQ